MLPRRFGNILRCYLRMHLQYLFRGVASVSISVIAQPLPLLPNGNNSKSHEDSNRHLDKTMRRNYPWCPGSWNEHDDRQSDAGISITRLFQTQSERQDSE